LTGCRFLIAIIIIRQAGVATYGEYALVLSLLLLAECVVDFGMSDSVVRMMCQEPEKQPHLFYLLIQAKAILSIVGVVLLLGILWGMDYPTYLLLAGGIATLALLAFAGILILRTLFKINMLMEREVVAEIVSVVAVLPCIPFVARLESALILLIGCYALSRYLFLFVGWFLGRDRLVVKCSGEFDNPDLAMVFKVSLSLGVSYILIRVYDVLDPILLSKMVSSEAVGHYLGCMRFLALLLMITYPVVTTAFPILSSCWQKSMGRFEEVTQATFQVVVVIAAWVLCIFNVSAGFFLGLMGEEMVVAKDIFRTLTLYAFLQSIMAFIGSLMIVSGGYTVVIMVTCLSVSTKLSLLFFFVPKYGGIGAAYASLTTECIIIVLSWALIQRKIGFNFDWKLVTKVILISFMLIYFINIIGVRDQITGGILAAVLFPVLIGVSGTVSLAQFKHLVNAIRVRELREK